MPRAACFDGRNVLFQPILSSHRFASISPLCCHPDGECAGRIQNEWWRRKGLGLCNQHPLFLSRPAAQVGYKMSGGGRRVVPGFGTGKGRGQSNQPPIFLAQGTSSGCTETVDGKTTRGPSGATMCITSVMRGRRQGDSHARGSQVSCFETCHARHRLLSRC